MVLIAHKWANYRDLFTALIHDNAQELRRLINTVTESLDALDNLQRPVHQTEDLLVFLVVKQLDATSRHHWEMSLGSSTKAATMRMLQDFLEGRIRAHEALGPSNRNTQRTIDRTRATTRCQSHVTATREQHCALCGGGHFILYCPTFKGKSATQRREIVTTKQLYFNCLSSHHAVPADWRKTVRRAMDIIPFCTGLVTISQ